MALRLLLRAAMRWGFLLGVLAVLGCQRSGIQAVLGDVELSSRTLHFEPTFVGYPADRPLVLRNNSRMDRAVSMVIAGPFSAEASVTVPGGSEKQLVVRFSPLEVGPAVGSLTLSEGQNVFEVALDGEGVRAPACTPSAPCRSSAFDPVSGACVETTAADGATCVSDNACFLGGTCSKGLCLGSARDCSDADRCTVDACDPAGGCMHLPLACGAPKDPCKVASCDPALGCVVSDAADGTSCGPSDCLTAQVCLLGACKSLPVPDGAACGDTTPCQGKGICQQQACVRPPPVPLTEAWSYDFPGVIAGFRGVTDAAENLYWIECALSLADPYCNSCYQCAATSFTRNGALRFRKPLGGLASYSYEQDPPHLIAGDKLVYGMLSKVSALATTNGALAWTKDFSTLPNAPDTADHFETSALLSDPTGVYVLGRRLNNSEPRQGVLLKLDPATGAVLSTRFFNGTLLGGVIDTSNNLYLGVASNTFNQGTPAHLISLTSAGVDRWSVIGSRPVAVNAGELILPGGGVLSTIDGTLRAEAPKDGVMRNPIMGAASRTMLIIPPNPCCPSCPCPAILPKADAIRLQAGSVAIDWQTNIASTYGSGIWGAVSDVVATRQGDLLVAGSTAGGPSQLHALDGSGGKRFSCELPTTDPYGGSTSRFNSPVALISGRWAVVEDIECNFCTHNPNPRLRVFEVPGERPTLHGWVGAQGSPSGGSRPLP